ncbi:MAG: 5-(carboxyamino)imidazole ribonucleotide mutase [Treponema sp.]|jgi:5-(carboxyamino)imidazole ribonucleotide mutase|nr:5-(carboxyamino)imidazole ribonucleotide mutase [Treponema sp.]MBQ2551433.1 5-(carboxyamino)imidazole ribonucleotide mutase [Treponema sp.]MBQ5384106.1 5-(carboxyamino)imidazole ribonucleotide mutase [Treponema sp.]
MKVAIFFGSKSDTETMKKSADVLKEFGVEYKAFIISAHRAGELLVKTIRQIEDEGFEVIIAGAGLSAALPGVIAGHTVLPVVGVPLECINPGKSNGLGGMDALLSVVQMPPQIPVASVGIGNAKNAAYLAIEILAVKYPELKTKLIDFRKKLAADAEANGGLGVEL